MCGSDPTALVRPQSEPSVPASKDDITTIPSSALSADQIAASVAKAMAIVPPPGRVDSTDTRSEKFFRQSPAGDCEDPSVLVSGGGRTTSDNVITRGPPGALLSPDRPPAGPSPGFIAAGSSCVDGAIRKTIGYAYDSDFDNEINAPDQSQQTNPELNASLEKTKSSDAAPYDDPSSTEAETAVETTETTETEAAQTDTEHSLFRNERLVPLVAEESSAPVDASRQLPQELPLPQELRLPQEELELLHPAGALVAATSTNSPLTATSPPRTSLLPPTATSSMPSMQFEEVPAAEQGEALSVASEVEARIAEMERMLQEARLVDGAVGVAEEEEEVEVVESSRVGEEARKEKTRKEENLKQIFAQAAENAKEGSSPVKEGQLQTAGGGGLVETANATYAFDDFEEEDDE